MQQKSRTIILVLITLLCNLSFVWVAECLSGSVSTLATTVMTATYGTIYFVAVVRAVIEPHSTYSKQRIRADLDRINKMTTG